MTLPPGGEPLPADPPWEAWPPAEVALRLRGVSAPWAFAAGWALDLFLGRVSRDHGDTEICVPSGSFEHLRRALEPGVFDVVGGGHRWPGADAAALAAGHQTWLRDPITGVYHLDVFREPHDGEIWVYRRDRTIRRPYAEVIHLTAEGLPYLAPEVVLLFKAKASRPKDELDFERVLPALSSRARDWLSAALEQGHPGHRWLPRLLDPQSTPRGPEDSNRPL